MAKRKKSRTPAPPRRPAAPRSSTSSTTESATATAPRPVQAPKVRTGKRRTQAENERRTRILLYSLAGAGVVGLVAAVLAVFVIGKGGGTTAHFDGPNVDFPNLKGLMKTPPPWPKNTATLRQRLKPDGLTPLGQEGQVLHIHQHLDIYVNGKHATVPQFIGIKLKKGKLDFITELHTHSTDGVIHLESPVAQSYSLGQFFGAWGLNLSRNCIGNLCSPAQPLRFYVNGKQVTGDPVRLVLQQHDEIAIVYGTPPAKIPSSFNWPVGE